ncbi:MAG: hypothetical protein V2B19_07805 [Pseudomonadota bacterium]
MSRSLPVLLFCFFLSFVSELLILPARSVSAAGPDPASAEMIVAVIGTGKVQGEDMDTARTQAISNSLVTAIDRAMGDLMPLPVKIERFKALNSALYSDPERFVVGFKVLAETVSGKTYRVLVEATLSMSALRKYLAEAKMLPEETAPRRVLFLITEQNVDDPAPGFWWGNEPSSAMGACESRMTEVLQQQGIQIVPHDQHPPTVREEKPGASPLGPDPSDIEALALGKRFQADVIIVALATGQSVGNVMGESQKSFKGVLAGRMLRTDTGEKIGDIYRTAVAVGSDSQSGGRQALNDVGALAAEVLMPQLKAPWPKKTDVNISATLIVEGTRKLMHFVAFRILLKEIPMVSEVETSGIKPNETTLSVRLKGTTQALADALMLKSNEGFGISITKISEDTLRLALVPK